MVGETDTNSVERDLRPVVARDRVGTTSVWIFAGFAAIAAVLLFTALDKRRRELVAPATTIPAEGSANIVAPPPLVIPEGRGADTRFRVIPRLAAVVPTRGPVPPIARPQPVAVREAPQDVVPAIAAEPPTPLPPSSGPEVVYNGRDAQFRQSTEAPQSGEDDDEERVSARRLANPSTTVPLGTVIPAVLETALDSTRPGGVRAIVSRDVRGFDGSRVLVPRGSRLYGEYEAGLEAGQKRALVRWTRLLRPDGAMIALDSPASDPLGRAGVKGKVDSHFFERFGGAILQSVLDIGVGVATRRAVGDGVIVALPGSVQTVTGRTTSEVQRTLTVKQGTSVSVFVARDLDFTSVER